jgi:serine/threonine-protein kinase
MKDTGNGFWSRLPVVALMVLVLLAAGALSAVTAMRLAIQGREVEVPDLAGTTEREAGLRLDERGLGLIVDGRRFNELVPEGRVFDQLPRAAARVKIDRSVRVRISLGERKFAVPDVRGASLRATRLQLVERGLTPGSTLYSHTREGEAGTVLFQDPDPGANESDPAVSVLVSLGPADQYFVMPALTGRSAAEARIRIRDAGFRLTEIPEAEAGGVPPGRVVRQQPSAGSRVSKDDTIVLGVSP